MTQNNEQDGKLTLSRPGRLELKKTVETGQVRQSFSHGRTKSVTVEVRKKRTFERGASGRMRAVQDTDALQGEISGLPDDSDNLTEQERAARVRALHDAAADEERRRIDETLHYARIFNAKELTNAKNKISKLWQIDKNKERTREIKLKGIDAREEWNEFVVDLTEQVQGPYWEVLSFFEMLKSMSKLCTMP